MAAASGLRILDTDHLAEQTSGDGDLERDLLAMFEAQCARLIPLILTPGPGMRRAEALHTLRGGALTVGAARLADLGEMLETALRGTDGDEDIEPLLAGLRDAASDLQREIGHWRRRLGHSSPDSGPGGALAKPDRLA